MVILIHHVPVAALMAPVGPIAKLLLRPTKVSISLSKVPFIKVYDIISYFSFHYIMFIK